MTTFQDPPPQSRRSARQNERGDEQPETPPFVQFSGEQPPFQQDVSVTTSGRRAGPTTPEQPVSAQQPFAAEPLNYMTQGGQPANYETQLPTASYAPAPQAPAGYRERDFSPEGSGRRAAAPPLIEPQQQAYMTGASDLDYRTHAGPAAPLAQQTLSPRETQGPQEARGPQQVASRRELRQRHVEAEAEAAAGLITQQTSSQYTTQPPPYQAQPPTNQAQPPTMGSPSTMTVPPALVGPPSMVAVSPDSHASSQTALSTAMAEFETLTRNGQPPAPNANQRVGDYPTESVAPTFIEPQLERTSGWVAPVGHWSRQADLDDETQPWENTITREVGVGNVATTTSALVLPEIPRPSNFSTALDSTGEVLLTGSIDLPQSLSTGGGDPRRYDDANVDFMFDNQDAEFTSNDSSPVRATRAVSTHTSSRGVIHTKKPRGNRLIVVVFIATAILAVGVVGMLVASIVLNLF